MKNKGFFKTAAALLAALVLLGGFSVTAYAGGGEDIPTNDSGVIVETEPQPLTPDGNAKCKASPFPLCAFNLTSTLLLDKESDAR